MYCYSFVILVIFCNLFVAFTKADWENSLVLETLNTRPNTSMVVAVLPLRLTFCKLATVAEGKTKEQLLKALHYQPNTKLNSLYTSISEMLSKLRQTDLVLLNKLYVNYSSEVNTGFLTNASSSYGVNVEFVGFNTPRSAFSFINNGIATATFQRIKDVVEHSDITPHTKMMLIVAAHLKATWEVPFDIKLTKTRKFYHLNNKVSEIPMMVREDSYQMYETKNYKVLTTHLRSSGASITLVVPSLSRGMPGFLAELKNNPNLMKNARAAMTIQQRKLVMPRIKIKSYLDLTEIFKKSTVSEMLNSNSSDLDGILKEEFRTYRNMYVNKIKQKLFIDVDELGVSRQPMDAEDQYSLGVRMGPMSAREFVADRPFYFIIDLQEFIPSREKLTIIYHQVFTGVYYGPE